MKWKLILDIMVGKAEEKRGDNYNIMCSICGGNYPLELVKKASETMKHRGPDFSGEFSDGIISLAHNRLSIIDLDSEANQPFTSPFCPHLVLVFNGEIYNYKELRQELKKQGIPFFTQSDTEVLLHAYAFLGEECLQRLNGDFAFCILDKRDDSLFLARDRLGNKPLFYALNQGKFFFASEIKAVLEIGKFSFDLEEVSKWILFSNGSENKTIYQGIFSFPPASFGRFSNGELKIKKYWECVPCVDLNLGQDEALERLEEILGDAVRIRLRSDVAVALSVSGGVDSSILAHLANKMGAKCHYFGVNFKESNQDETKHIKQLQRDLGVEINYIAPTLENIKDDFLNLVQTQDEIFRSFSIYSQYLLFKSIAPFCKVVLGGQGADELFGGYYHHIGRYIFSNPIEFENRIKLYGNEALREYQFGLKCSLRDSLKMQLFFEDNQGGIEKLKKMGFFIPSMENLLERFLLDFNQGLWLDTFRYNLPNLLRYEDRNAMAFGIENRTPFTDYRVVEFAFNLDSNLKFARGYSKYILRLLLEKMGSKELAWRKDKVGFSAPEVQLMQTLGYNYESLFDIRMMVFEGLRGRI